MKNSFYLLLFLIVVSCSHQNVDYRHTVNLAGKWRFKLDTNNTGINNRWFSTELSDSIDLPGTTDENKKGFKNTDVSTEHLNRIYQYEGIAWYQKNITIPSEAEGKHIYLYLERTRNAMVWLDDKLIGTSSLLQSPQIYIIPDNIKAGNHTLSIRVNNSLELTPYGDVHIYSDGTQTNWNGILGELKLIVTDKTYISDLQIYPDIHNKKISVKINIDNQLNADTAEITLQIIKKEKGKTTKLEPYTQRVDCNKTVVLEYVFDDDLCLWDEYNQPLYYITAILETPLSKDSKTVSFGMREFKVNGTQFSINDRTTFLRGKHEAAVFPLTGYPPMNVESWRQVYKIAKSYGINHYRFHSYCPPEAAFTAADLEGIYIQAELPFWGGLESDTIALQLQKEGLAMLKSYANHPSFVMFSHGNEIWSGHDRVEKNIMEFKKHDNRPLYTFGSNNGIGYIPPKSCSDYFIGARTPYRYDTILTHTRLTHCYADSKGGGILNTQPPSTKITFDYAIKSLSIPIVSHEIGQYQIYPNYNEIEKYTGVLKASNLEEFKHRLANKGMANMDSAFQKASGAWSALCYKAEMEAALRTKGMAGFQLLDLQDFPGQGTALVGILDAFMDSKGVISPEVWKQSCNDVVLLAEFPKFCYTNIETFEADIVIANYSNADYKNKLHWSLSKSNGEKVESGNFPELYTVMGNLTSIGKIHVPLNTIKDAEKLNLSIQLDETNYTNNYFIWVYPDPQSIAIPKEIIISEKLNEDVFDNLDKGKSVLLFPQLDDIKDKCIAGHFPPEFWNYGMFKGISEWAKKPVSEGTLGILTNPQHPIFNAFPTDSYTNWQWFQIIKNGGALILDSTSKEYRPIIQVIDNLERNLKLGLIFEFRYGDGKLLVCMSPLPELIKYPEANQLYRSIVKYIQSDKFNPEYIINKEQLIALF